MIENAIVKFQKMMDDRMLESKIFSDAIRYYVIEEIIKTPEYQHLISHLGKPTQDSLI